jgi:hypothetical protein
MTVQILESSPYHKYIDASGRKNRIGGHKT